MKYDANKMPTRPLAEIPAYARKIRVLTNWCRQKWGRQTAMAKELGISIALFNHWLRFRREISLLQWLEAERIMRRISKKRKINRRKK
jgi:hypothetical protein